jgi:hypothetical protein
MRLILFFIMIFYSYLFSFENTNDSSNTLIEIYLLRINSSSIHEDGICGKLEVKKDDLVNNPFINDFEIIGYDTTTFTIFITDSARKRISILEPSLPIGIPFVITVNKKPVLSGYFWNPVSSWGCNWYVIFADNDNKLNIINELPPKRNKDLDDQRLNKDMIQAFKESKRIVNSK